MPDSSSFNRMNFIQHSGSSFHLDDLSMPFTPQVRLGDDVFSNITRGAIHQCLSKSNVDRVVHFGRPDCHLADHPPPSYVTVYPCFHFDVFLKLPFTPFPLIVSFLEYTGLALS